MYGLYKKYRPNHRYYTGRWDATKSLDERLEQHKTGEVISSTEGMKRDNICPDQLIIKQLFVFDDEDNPHREREEISISRELGQSEWNRYPWLGGTAVGPCSDEHKEKISASLTGRPHSEEHKRKISESCMGRIISEEARRKNSETQKRLKRNPSEKVLSHLRKLSKANIGRKVSEETKQRLREINIGRKASEETKRKISASLRGRKMSEETKRKISATLMGRTIPREIVDRISKSLTGHKHTQKSKDKMRIAQRKRAKREWQQKTGRYKE